MKKLILIVVVLLTFTACQKDDITAVDGRTEIVLKLKNVDYKAQYTAEQWAEIEVIYKAEQFRTKAAGYPPIPDDLEYINHYVDDNGRHMLTYGSESEGGIWGVQWHDGSNYNSGFKLLMKDERGWPWLLWQANWKPVQL